LERYDGNLSYNGSQASPDCCENGAGFFVCVSDRNDIAVGLVSHGHSVRMRVKLHRDASDEEIQSIFAAYGITELPCSVGSLLPGTSGRVGMGEE
jgi:hypothetical protein